jgi:hypothetical protein
MKASRIVTTHFGPRNLALAVVVGASVFGAACGGKAKPKTMSLQEMIAADPLPLAKGAKWSYKVSVTKYDSDKNIDVTKELDWSSEVVDAKEANGVTAYTVKGWPTDLIEYDQTPTATERTILRSGNSFLWAEKAEPSLDDTEGWFTWPLIDGQRICPEAQSGYCWQVAANDTGYALTYFTGPDEVTYDLQPGTGVSRFRYSHHGTTNTVEAKLVSFKKGK